MIKLISPPFECTSITNRVLSLFDCFTTYYNCMTWNVRKLISFPFQCTSITNRVLNLFDRLLQLYDLKQKTSQIVFFTLLTTVWPKMSENSYLHHFSAQVSQIVFLAYLTVLRLITTVWPVLLNLTILRHLKCQKTHISTISVHKYHKSCS